MHNPILFPPRDKVSFKFDVPNSEKSFTFHRENKAVNIRNVEILCTGEEDIAYEGMPSQKCYHIAFHCVSGRVYRWHFKNEEQRDEVFIAIKINVGFTVS